jgi:hypothetical protein
VAPPRRAGDVEGRRDSPQPVGVPASAGRGVLNSVPELTVVLYKKRNVKANCAFKRGELKEADIPGILKELPKILN